MLPCKIVINKRRNLTINRMQPSRKKRDQELEFIAIFWAERNLSYVWNIKFGTFLRQKNPSTNCESRKL